MLEVVHQDNALAVLLQTRHYRGDYLLGLTDLEVERVHISGEDADVACAEIRKQFGGVPQGRKAEEWSFGLAQRHADCADALLDLILSLVGRQLREIGMRPSVGANCVPCGSHLLENLRMPHGMLADREEQRLGALRCQRLEYGWRIAGPWTIVESQNYFP